MSKELVFIHGSGDSAGIWRSQMEHFEIQKAIAIDLPGHGLRPDNLPSTATVQDYAHAVYNIVVCELQLERPIIAGHSLGGAIALMMALEHGTKLAGLILIGTGARLRVAPSLLEEAKNFPQQARLHLVSLGIAQGTPQAEALTQQIIQEQIPPGPTMLFRDLAACNSFDIMSQLAEIQLPTLIFCGVHDRLTPLKYSEYLHKQIADSVLQPISNAGHYVQIEQNEIFNVLIDQWLNR